MSSSSFYAKVTYRKNGYPDIVDAPGRLSTVVVLGKGAVGLN